MLRLLIDENVHGDITDEVRRRQPGLDVVRVQEAALMNTPDPDLLAWAAQHDRVVVSLDKKTLVDCAWDRVRQGLIVPGVLILLRMTFGQAIDELDSRPLPVIPMT